MTCRTEDYAKIEAKLAKAGAVRCLPLDDDQIQAFLDLKKQPNLWKTLHADPALLELARTPLLLTLISNIAGLDDRAIDLQNGRSSSVFDAYIHRSYLFEVQKRTGTSLPFDELTTRANLSQIAGRIFFDRDVKHRLHQRDIALLLGNTASSFVDFACTIHLLRRDGDEYSFPHLELEDYCLVASLVEVVKTHTTILRRLHEATHADKSLPVFGWAINKVRSMALWTRNKTLRPGSTQEVARDLETAIDKLGKIGDVRGVSPLLELLRTHTQYKLDDWTQFNIDREVIRALAQIGGDEAFRGLVAELERRKWDDFILVETLGDMGIPEAVPALLEALKSGFDTNREKAAEALGKLADKRAVDGLIKALTDEDEDVLNQAVQALGNIGDARAVESLVRMIPESNTIWGGSRVPIDYTLTALAKIHNTKAINGLVQMLAHNVRVVRQEASLALRDMHDPGTVNSLISAITNNG